jgi:hypothetical protein
MPKPDLKKPDHPPAPNAVKREGDLAAAAPAAAPALHLQVRDNDNNTADFYAAGDGNCWEWATIGDWNDKIVGFVCAVGDWTFYQDVNFNQLPGGGNTGGFVVTCKQGTAAHWTDDVGIEREKISSFRACPART